MKSGDVVIFKEGGFSFPVTCRIIECGNFWAKVEFASGTWAGTSMSNLFPASPAEQAQFDQAKQERLLPPASIALPGMNWRPA